MLTLIHGDDQTKTRNELQQYSSDDTVRLDGKSLDLNTLIQSLESGSFFADSNRLVVVENLHKMRSKTELKAILEYIASQDPQTLNLVLWESQELTPAQVKKFVRAKVVTAKISPLIFKLIDSITPKSDPKTTLPLFQEAIKTDASEKIIIQIAGQLRLMIQTLDPAFVFPPQLSWKKMSITKNATCFGLPRLIELHHQLAEMDYQNKTGQLPLNLASELKMWFAQL